MTPLPEDVTRNTDDVNPVKLTNLTSYSETSASATDFSLGCSEIVTLLEDALTMKLTSIPSNDVTPVLTKAIASLAQGKTFKNQYELDVLVKYISEHVAQLVNSEPDSRVITLDLKTKPSPQPDCNVAVPGPDC